MSLPFLSLTRTLSLLCQLCLRIWLWGLAYIEACRADSKLAGRGANDCLALCYIWWQEVSGNSLKVTRTLPEENVWLEWFALNLGTDKRCFCLRLNSSLEMKKGLIIHKAKMGWHWTAGPIWQFRLKTWKVLPLYIFKTAKVATHNEMNSDNEYNITQCLSTIKSFIIRPQHI